MGDFNCEYTETAITEYCDLYNLKNLINEQTCFRNIEDPTCIDLILTTMYRSFQNSTTAECGLSDLLKMNITVLKSFFRKAPPQIISYRDYKNYSHANLRKELEETLTPNIYIV